jgi:predicted dehydrogenase
MACHISLMRGGILKRPSNLTWMRDSELGANTLTIAGGHTIDALRFVVGDFSRMACVLATEARQWLETDTEKMVDVSSPDNVLVSGWLRNGAVASVHVASNPWAGSGYRMEIYGREGTLVASGDDSPQYCDVHLHGVRGGNALSEMTIPPRFVYLQTTMPEVEAYNVGQLYCEFARAIRTGHGRQPTFDTAVEVHRIIDVIRQSSDCGRQMNVVSSHRIDDNHDFCAKLDHSSAD